MDSSHSRGRTCPCCGTIYIRINVGMGCPTPQQSHVHYDQCAEPVETLRGERGCLQIARSSRVALEACAAFEGASAQIAHTGSWAWEQNRRCRSGICRMFDTFVSTGWADLFPTFVELQPEPATGDAGGAHAEPAQGNSTSPARR